MIPGIAWAAFGRLMRHGAWVLGLDTESTVIHGGLCILEQHLNGLDNSSSP